MHRSGTQSAQGYYSVISCNLSPLERVRAAAKRAAFEEVGVEIEEEDMVLRAVMDGLSPNGNKYFSPFFETFHWKGEITNQQSERHQDLGFFPLNKLPDKLLPYVEVALKDLNREVNGGEEARRSWVSYLEYDGTTLSD